jgi:hypothetical protein
MPVSPRARRRRRSPPDSGTDGTARRSVTWHADLLALDPTPAPALALAATLGFLGWVAAAFGFLFRGLDADLRLVQPSARRWSLVSPAASASGCSVYGTHEKSSRWCSALGSAAAATPARANVFEVFGANERARAMAGAMTATASDVAAVWHNPAGLSPWRPTACPSGSPGRSIARASSWRRARAGTTRRTTRLRLNDRRDGGDQGRDPGRDAGRHHPPVLGQSARRSCSIYFPSGRFCARRRPPPGRAAAVLRESAAVRTPRRASEVRGHRARA